MIFDGDGCDIDITKPFLRVTSYKSTGKWYATKYTELDGEELGLIENNYGFLIEERFRQKQVEIKKFMPISNFEGFITVEGFNCKFIHRLITYV